MAEHHYRYKIQAAQGYLLDKQFSDRRVKGSVQTPLGIVAVLAYQKSKHFGGFASFRIVHDGYLHSMRRDGEFTHRGLVMIAHRFAKAVVNG